MSSKSGSSASVASAAPLFKSDEASKAGIAAANAAGQAIFRKVLESAISYFIVCLPSDGDMFPWRMLSKRRLFDSATHS